MKYPKTTKKPVIESIFGTTVIDNYRWLEDDKSAETKAWVKTENEVTLKYLSKIPYREELKNRLSELWNYVKVGIPIIHGNYTYFSKNNGLQNQDVIYRKKGDAEAEVFLDPNTFSEDATTSLGSLNFSEDGKTAAYSISEGGSDWRKIIVIDAASKISTEDALVDIKFSGVSWYKNEGFYYSSYDKPKGSELSAKTDQHKLYYHKLGTSQKEDVIVFGGIPSEKHRYVFGSLTEDYKYLVITAQVSTSGNKLFIKDASNPNSKLITILDHVESDTHIIHNTGSKLYLTTNLNAPNKKIITVDAANPTSENWKDFIQETENVLSPSTGAGFIFATYMVDAVSKVLQYDFEGNLLREVKLPGVGSVGGFGGKTVSKELYFSFTNYKTPASSFKFNPTNGTYTNYWEPSIAFNSDAFESNQVFYTSKDGTKIPMIITHKKGVKLDRKNPTILYGYGGFNVSLTPAFSIANAVWMEQGGIYAVPNLRGGGEYGKKMA